MFTEVEARIPAKVITVVNVVVVAVVCVCPCYNVFGGQRQLCGVGFPLLLYVGSRDGS